ncbi:MAG: lipocalin family protein [Bacteroidota bacterium]
MASCSSNEHATTESQEEGMSDSILVEILEAGPSISPELIGTWRMEEMRYGNTPMSIEDTGESTLEFTDKGTMITSAPGLSPEETTFTFENDVIVSDLDGLTQKIVELSGDRLVLVYEIDNTEIKRIFTRVTP